MSYGYLVAGNRKMRVWFACFIILFALAELFDWVQKFNLPLPIYILGGAFLAVASNYNKIVGVYFSERPIAPAPETPRLDIVSTAPVLEEAKKLEP